MLEILMLLSIFTGGATAGIGAGTDRVVSEPVAATQEAPAPASTAPAAPAIVALVPAPEPAPAAPTGFTPEDQTPSGKFTTATEIKPILTATKGSWIALREWDGRDLIYFTHLESWRCGLHAVWFGVNGAPPTTRYELAPCNPDAPAPNALPSDGGHLPYLRMPLQSVQQVDIRILYDDGTEDTGSFLRKNVLLP